MPELTLEIGGRVFEVACELGQEPSLERAAAMLNAEADRVTDAMGRSTEKRMLLLAGLMLADSMTGVESKLAAAEERLRAAEERARIAEAKSAMLAANALKLETEASHKASPAEVAQLREEHQAALELLSKLLDEINAIAEAGERKRA
jgi:cell division protein ZapA